MERRLLVAQIQPWCASRRLVCEVSEVDPHQSPIRIEQRPRCCRPRVPPASESMPENVTACPFDLHRAVAHTRGCVQPQVAHAGVRIERENPETGAPPRPWNSRSYKPCSWLTRRSQSSTDRGVPLSVTCARHGAAPVQRRGIEQRCCTGGPALLRRRTAVLLRSRSGAPRGAVAPWGRSVPKRGAQRS